MMNVFWIGTASLYLDDQLHSAVIMDAITIVSLSTVSSLRSVTSSCVVFLSGPLIKVKDEEDIGNLAM